MTTKTKPFGGGRVIECDGRWHRLKSPDGQTHIEGPCHCQDQKPTKDWFSAPPPKPKERKA